MGFMGFNTGTDNSDMTDICNHGALECLFTYAKNKESAIQYCEAWLQLFGTWENFVKENYLEAFVDKKGVPKKFFSGHSIEKMGQNQWVKGLQHSVFQIYKMRKRRFWNMYTVLCR